MDFRVKKFLGELLHFLYIVLQAFIGVRFDWKYFCGMSCFCWKKVTPCRITKF